MLLVTRDDAVSGFNGLVVVFARRIAIAPEAPIPTPIRAMIAATIVPARPPAAIAGVTRDTAHIAATASNATTGGGTFSSSAAMFDLQG
jgi:hypothetical protein